MVITTECMSCGKIINNPFVDTDSKGKIYFFCNKKHRDDHEERQINIAFLMNPFGAGHIAYHIVWDYIKDKFKSYKKWL